MVHILQWDCVHVLFHSFFSRSVRVWIVIWLRGWCEVDLWFFHFSAKIKREACVLCCLFFFFFFFHSPSILDLTTRHLQNSICQPGWISVRDLTSVVLLSCSGGQTGPGSLVVGVGLKTVRLCLTHCEIGFQRLVGGGSTKSYYASQDVLIVQRALPARRWVHLRGKMMGLGLFVFFVFFQEWKMCK